MHDNFYHWHGRAEIKPDVALLEKRWEAAVAAITNYGAAEVQYLLRLVLFPGANPESAKGFCAAIVKLEPTFPPEENAELLRAMATANVYNKITQKPSPIADALALGIQAAEFGGQRIDPVCKEVIACAHEYLASESERMRPAPAVDGAIKAEKQAEAQIQALKQAVTTNNHQTIGNATAELGSKLLTAMSTCREQWERLMEESQFLWWLVGRRSTKLQAQRGTMNSEYYALPAAAEAAERVAMLPPPASIESLIVEALAQCKQPDSECVELLKIISEANPNWAKESATPAQPPELTPIAALIKAHNSGGKIDASYLKRLRLLPEMKASSADASRQYFRELMFLRAINDLS